MKNMIKLPAVILGLMLLFTGITQKAMAQDDDISLETFYDELAPYGSWLQDPEYGYVWRPDVNQNDFRPYYTDGRWVMTEYGNTWVSDYEWGWAPFHYGRWVTNRFNQWIWIPDTVWGPAWVSWRSGGGYYGWAPLGPGFDMSIGFNGGSYNTPNDWWVFIPQISIYSNRYPRYSNRNITIINQTTYINNRYGRNNYGYYTGPRADDIRRVTNRDVRVYSTSRVDRPGRTRITNNNVNIYNPRRGRGGANGRPGQPDRNNGSAPARPQNGVRPGNNGNGRPDRPDRTNGATPARPENTVRPVENGNSNSRPGRPDRANQGRGNNMQRPNESVRGENDRLQRIQQRDGQERQQRDNQQREQREGQQRQEQQQRDNQQRQQREGQQRQEQQQRDNQQRQQRESQQQQTRPARTEGQAQPPARTESSRSGRGGRGN